MDDEDERGDAGDDVLRLRACPGCDYSLEALPAVGVCPECGRGYDRTYVVVSCGVSGEGNRVWEKWRTYALEGAGLLLMVFVVLKWRRLMEKPLVMGPMAAYAVNFKAKLYAELFSVRESRAQSWVSEGGIARASCTPEGRVVGWVSENSGRLCFLAALVVILLVGGTDPAWMKWVVVAVVGIFLGRWWVKGRGGWAEVHEDRDVPRLLPWDAVERWNVEMVGERKARVWCQVTREGLVPGGRAMAVDMEIECDEAFAMALRARIMHWWRAARQRVTAE